GIGQKVAQRIILELKDRLGAPVSAVSTPAARGQEAWRDQVHLGLVGLGWPAREAERAVDAVADQAGDTPDVGALLRSALQTLSRA
ncbi:MAG TPA: Holliday junction branch migration protein RuvA, partial [Nocardioides sp.]|nr:Holliday junction branch migration protein RuvA [Nocardioides sp.]